MSAKGHPCASCQSLLGPSAPASNAGGHGCRICLVCGGQGWRKRRKGEEPWDDHARVKLASGDVGEGTEGDDLERRLARTTRLLDEWERPESVAYGWETQRELMWKQGDYGELEKALRRLDVAAPGIYRMWWRIVVLGEPLQLSPRIVSALEAATEFLAEEMPKRTLRVPRHLRPENHNEARKTSLWRGQTKAHKMQRAERARAIVEQRLEGWNIAKIAAYHAITDRRVKQIIREETQAMPVASAPA